MDMTPQTPPTADDPLAALAAEARRLKYEFVALRNAGADYGRLGLAAQAYTKAIGAWHKARWPGKRFVAPSLAYLIRAL